MRGGGAQALQRPGAVAGGLAAVACPGLPQLLEFNLVIRALHVYIVSLHIEINMCVCSVHGSTAGT
jgi:hypothetical protein